MTVECKLSLPFFLVATPQLDDPHFTKAVVLIVEHDVHGSLGFIINRPIGIKLSELVGPRDYDIPADITGWYGGPVKTDTGVVLSLANHEHAMQQSVVLSSAERALKQLVEHSRSRLVLRRSSDDAKNQEHRQTPQPLYPFRFLVGYAGWGAGQLSEELRDGTWIQVPYSHDLLYDTNWKTLWERALLGVGVNPRQLITPQQHYLN